MHVARLDIFCCQMAFVAQASQRPHHTPTAGYLIIWAAELRHNTPIQQGRRTQESHCSGTTSLPISVIEPPIAGRPRVLPGDASAPAAQLVL